MLAALLPLLAVVGSTVKAAPLQRRDLSTVVYNCNHDFAYTWDDGPYIYHNEILDDFDAVGAKTTFFVNGDNWSCIYDDDNVAALRRTFEEGHQIASHTWSHASLTDISFAQIDIELQRLDEAFVKILGVRPKMLRPPYGNINDNVANYIQNTYGKTIVMWSDDSTDSTGGSVQDSYNFYAGWAAQGPGHPHICLSHETEPSGIGALREGTVNLLHNAGINMVTVAQCTDKDAYEYVGPYQNRDSSWYCGGSWTPSSPPPSSSTTTSGSGSCLTTYHSVTGDTCANIGARYGLSANAILAANTFLDCSDIWVNTPICIPRGGATSTTTTTTTSTTTTTTSTSSPSCVSTYYSVTGDTCTTIGQHFGLSANAILAANTFLNCNDVWVRTPICVPPGGVTTSPTTTTTRTSSTTTTRTSSTTPAPGCVQTYISRAGDTCQSIGSAFGLSATAILNANTFLNCQDIWTYTPICIPPGGSGPTTTTTTTTTTTSSSNPSCVSTYTSAVGDTCQTIGNKFGLSANAILAANTFLNCQDIWTYTPICIPPGGTPPTTCTQTYRSVANDTCDSIGAKFGVSGDQILAWNTFLTCNDIWVNTPVCV